MTHTQVPAQLSNGARHAYNEAVAAVTQAHGAEAAAPPPPVVGRLGALAARARKAQKSDIAQRGRAHLVDVRSRLQGKMPETPRRVAGEALALTRAAVAVGSLAGIGLAGETSAKMNSWGDRIADRLQQRGDRIKARPAAFLDNSRAWGRGVAQKVAGLKERNARYWQDVAVGTVGHNLAKAEKRRTAQKKRSGTAVDLIATDPLKGAKELVSAAVSGSLARVSGRKVIGGMEKATARTATSGVRQARTATHSAVRAGHQQRAQARLAPRR